MEHSLQRAADFASNDHDLLIALRADVRNLIERFDRQFNDTQRSIAEHEAEMTRLILDQEQRLKGIETRLGTNEQSIATIKMAGNVGREIIVLAVGFGTLATTVVGLLLRASGHL